MGNQTHGVERGAAGQLALVHEDDIRTPCFGKVIGHAGSKHASSDDNHLCLITHGLSPF